MTSAPKSGSPECRDSGNHPTAEEVVARLNEFRARRGYVNPQQGPLAAALPAVFDGYRVIYKALILDDKHLGPMEKEFIWLSLLCVANEMGTHHIKLFYQHGGTPAQAQAAFRLAAWVAGVRAYEFIDENWQKYFPEVNAAESYLQGVDALIAGLDGVTAEWAHLALLCAHSGLKSHWGVLAELRACYAAGIPETKMAEAMSQAMWPCGVNCFHDAAGIWLNLIRSGEVKASAPFKAWADLPGGQDGLELDPHKPS
jgi:alkylhydroperoxidase/carboxymuconolactone decarboxylase family protein YurZ